MKTDNREPTIQLAFSLVATTLSNVYDLGRVRSKFIEGELNLEGTMINNKGLGWPMVEGLPCEAREKIYSNMIPTHIQDEDKEFIMRHQNGVGINPRLEGLSGGSISYVTALIIVRNRRCFLQALSSAMHLKECREKFLGKESKWA